NGARTTTPGAPTSTTTRGGSGAPTATRTNGACTNTPASAGAANAPRPARLSTPKKPRRLIRASPFRVRAHLALEERQTGSDFDGETAAEGVPCALRQAHTPSAAPAKPAQPFLSLPASGVTSAPRERKTQGTHATPLVLIPPILPILQT